MKNLRISLPLADGGLFPMEFDTAKQIVQQIAGDDWAAPPRSLVIEAQADDGRVVSITIPYDNRREVSVRIGEPGAFSPPFESGARVRNGRTNEIGTVKSCDFNGPVLVQTERGTTSQWGLEDVCRA